MGQPLAITATGLVTSVGLTAPAACAAIRAGVTNPIETEYLDSSGESIIGHRVPLAMPWKGPIKHVKMAASAIEEALGGLPRDEWPRIPLLLCVAERDRPGRFEGLDDELPLRLQQELNIRFSPQSATIAQGRISAAVALQQARTLIYDGNVPHVLIAAADSLLNWPTLTEYERADRLLTATNSNGFLPGEGAGALLVGKPSGDPELLCHGIGFGVERAEIGSSEPLRAEGLTIAIKAALADAGCHLHDLDFRITDISGEQYYFKEATIALSRILRRRKEIFDMWHPAECIGEAGAVAGIAIVAVANAACRKSYAPSNNILTHVANDGGERAAAVFQFRAT